MQNDPKKTETNAQAPTPIQNPWQERALDFGILLMHILPQNLLSFATGSLARVVWPRPLRFLIHRMFVEGFGINMEEAEKELEEYDSIEAIFTRKLKVGARMFQGDLVSPSDGYLVRSEGLKNLDAVQVKGLNYSIKDLVGEPDLEFQSGSPSSPAWYQTIYLAPHNYHRVHAPCAGTVTKIGHIPGRLFPVNEPTVLRVPRIFTRNERLVFKIKTAAGGTVWLVMVGAFNVGRMATPLSPFLVSNSEFGMGGAKPRWEEMARVVKKGDEIGTFMLGSTVVLVFDSKALELLGGEESMIPCVSKTPVLLGQKMVRGKDD